MVIALYKPNSFQLSLARLASILGISVLEWEGNANKKFKTTIKFPDSEKYTALMNESRIFLDDFFTTQFVSSRHEASNIYFRKSYDLYFFDYYVFQQQVKRSKKINNKIYSLGGGYRKYIFKRSKFQFFKYALFPWNAFLCYITLFIYAIKVYASCFFYGGNKPIHDVTYLRKKAYPDLGLKDKLCHHLNELNILNGNSITQFSNSEEKFGFSFLNALVNSKKRAIVTAFSVLKEIHLIILLQFKNDIPNKDIGVYIKDIFIAKSVINTESRIFIGVLVDKPMFTLLYQYKSPDQLIMGINESFFYPPFRSFDYNQLDVYFSMNLIDSDLQNKFGGFIDTVFPVEFFRDSLNTTSNGISDELKDLVRRYDNIIVATAMQVSESLFTQWGSEDVNNFVLGVIEVAQGNPSDLIILKGKKNELTHLKVSVLNSLSKLDNVFVIHSKKPRYLKYNQFEDLLEITDYLISMSHTSTTVWQAIAKDIPVIAINDVHPESFLSEYSYFEVTSKNMNRAYTYWKEKHTQELNQILSEIKHRVNIGRSNGLVQIAEYIASVLKKKRGVE